ncbi:myrosinase 1 [Folsomia candida]|uniref:beta-glucosidase n=1 Tax=Folsomia candida TaxID=158441 RepID=A0A226D4G2_FOLCA|nr:myrosinase 1 [Folsomia candida]OXA40455.1 Lactase-like protein [Folsomia candida]
MRSQARLFFLLFGLIGLVKCDEDEFLYGKFPPGFKWGLSVASYQTEGAYQEDGKGVSIWDTFTHQTPSPILDESNGDIACLSYHKSEEDVQLLKNMGATTYRFSLSWARILPNGTVDNINAKGIEYYDKLINLLIKNGIEPVVTLYHWDLPQHLQDLTGGWPSEEMIPYFVQYAELAFSKFGDRVKTWTTFNEAWVVCLIGYGEGVFAPGIKEISETPYKCAHTILKAHAQTYRMFDEKFRPKFGGKLGIVIDSGWYIAADENDPKDVDAVERALQFKHGLFASPLVFGKYPDIVRKYVDEKSQNEGRSSSRLPTFDEEWSTFLSGGVVDFLGLNHYTTQMVSAKPTRGPPSWYTDQDLSTYQDDAWPKSASSWLRVVPSGFRHILNWIKNTYGNIEVLVTENGFSDTADADWNDDDRVNYFKQYTNNMLKAVTIDGCNVTGYLGWSLLDNFEWASGYTERFGVHWVNFSDPDRTRTPKKSAAFLKELFTNNGFAKVDKKDEF